MPSIIHWFRRDLRLSDNAALSAAAQAAAGAVIPLFIFDDAVLRSERTGGARVRYLLESLQVLADTLAQHNSRLIIRHGQPAAVLTDIVQASGAQALYFNRDYTPFARQRDAAVSEQLQTHGTTVVTFKDAVLFEADEILTGAGKPYTVYSPYFRQWRARIERERAAYSADPPAVRLQRVPDTIKSEPLPDLAALGHHSNQDIIPAGEAAAQERLRHFSQTVAIGRYGEARNFPGEPGTSRMSADLRLGTIAPRACLRAALRALDAAGSGTPDIGQDVGGLQERQPDVPNRASSIETWISELAWRDFYYAILFHYPHVLRASFRPRYDALEWENNQRLFDAWCAGQTGYPFVDAAMRQLRAEAWMHNRARMVVASFLTKDLLVDWRWGDRYFMQMLIDGDHASNNGGWQWAASTGTDAQPYFRIFNPVSQGEKFDPQGAYVRRYVPELARVPNKYIHAPWTMPPAEQTRAGVRIGVDYPHPIVDHATQRARTLDIFKRIGPEKAQEA